METLTQDRVMAALEANSRTFFIPISRMPPGLKEATTSAYLCMRAIDEIEDHPTLSNAVKARILQQVSLAFQSHPYRNDADIAGGQLRSFAVQ